MALRLRLRGESALASVTVLPAAAGGGQQAPEAGRVDISIGSGAGLMTGCAVGPALNGSAVGAFGGADAAEWPGFAARGVVCGGGATGSVVRVSLGGAGGAVRICTVAASGAGTGAGRAVLWLPDVSGPASA